MAIRHAFICGLSTIALFSFAATSISFAQTTIDGGEGNDRITIGGTTGSTVNGISVRNTANGAVINGTNGNDIIIVGPAGASVNGVSVNIGSTTGLTNTLMLGPNGATVNGIPVLGGININGGNISIGNQGLSVNGSPVGLNYGALYGNIGSMVAGGSTTTGMLSSLAGILTNTGTTGLPTTATGSILTNLLGYQPNTTGNVINGTPGNDRIIIGPDGRATVNGVPVNTNVQGAIQAATSPSPGTTLLNQLIGGQVNASTFANTLTSSGMTQNQAAQFTNNIVNNTGATTGALGALTNSVMTGQMSPATALALSTSSQLGNISTVAGLAGLVSNPSVMTALNTALTSGGPNALTTQLGTILGTGANTQLATSLLQNPALAQQLTQALSSVLGPQLTAMLGGLTGLLSSLMGSMTTTLAQSSESQALQQIAQQRLQQSINLTNNIQCASCNCCQCHTPIIQDHKNIRAHMTNQFELFRIWLVSNWYPDNIVPMLMLMTSQMTTAALNQVFMFGALLDAKHQLETQRLFQQMTARAHKDYQPSEGMCEFGTATRSLAASERRADLAQVAFAQHMLKRTLKSGDVLSVEGRISDKASRLDQFLKEYCDKNDNGKGEGNKGGLETLCRQNVPAARRNRDIDFTNTLDVPLTLDVDFITPDNTNDEKDLFALSANLYAHDIPTKMTRTLLANDKGDLRTDAFPLYMDLRALTAKRSVAQNAMAAQAALKSKGAKEVAPFLKAFIRDLGLDETEVHKLIGEEPSYFAQMEVLTKKIYEDPRFYAELYDKPANVERKLAVMEALEIMQDRDIFDSLMRSEAILAVYLETLLNVEQDRVSTNIRKVINEGGQVTGAQGGGTAP